MQSGFCRANRDPGFEAPRDSEIVGLIDAVRIDLEREQYIGRRIETATIEARTQDANHHVWVSIKGNRFAYDLRIASELALPHSVANDCEVATPRAILLRGKGSPLCDRHPKEAEEIGSHCCRVDLLRISAATDVHEAEAIRGNILKDTGLLPPCVVFCGRPARKFALGPVNGEHNDPVRIGIRELPQQDRIDDRKNGHVGADTKRQRKNSHDREAGAFRQRSRSKLQVLPELVHFYPHGNSVAREDRLERKVA